MGSSSSFSGPSSKNDGFWFEVSDEATFVTNLICVAKLRPIRSKLVSSDSTVGVGSATDEDEAAVVDEASTGSDLSLKSVPKIEVAKKRENKSNKISVDIEKIQHKQMETAPALALVEDAVVGSVPKPQKSKFAPFLFFFFFFLSFFRNTSSSAFYHINNMYFTTLHGG
jgi:hypothetical protein